MRQRASVALELLLDALAAQEHELSERLNRAVQAEAAERGYPEDARFDIGTRMWTLPEPEPEAE